MTRCAPLQLEPNGNPSDEIYKTDMRVCTTVGRPWIQVPLSSVCLISSQTCQEAG